MVPQRGDEAGYITYGAYGNGDKPLLLCSVNTSKPGDWVHEGRNIWATTPPKLPVDVGNLIFNNEESVGVKVWNQEDIDLWFAIIDCIQDTEPGQRMISNGKINSVHKERYRW